MIERSSKKRSDALDDRFGSRKPISLYVDAWPAHLSETRVHILDISNRGARLGISGELEAGTFISIVLPEAGACEAEVVWSNEGQAGCRFMAPLPQAVVSASLLVAAPTARNNDEDDEPKYSLRRRVAIICGLAVLSLAAAIPTFLGLYKLLQQIIKL